MKQLTMERDVKTVVRQAAEETTREITEARAKETSGRGKLSAMQQSRMHGQQQQG